MMISHPEVGNVTETMVASVVANSQTEAEAKLLQSLSGSPANKHLWEFNYLYSQNLQEFLELFDQKDLIEFNLLRPNDN